MSADGQLTGLGLRLGLATGTCERRTSERRTEQFILSTTRPAPNPTDGRATAAEFEEATSLEKKEKGKTGASATDERC